MKIAIIHSQDHREHVMLNRVIKALVEAEVDVHVIDGGREAEQTWGYRQIGVRAWEGAIGVRVVWAVVRRLGSSWLNDQFWRCMLYLRMFVNALRLGWAAAGEEPDRYAACDLLSAAAALFARKRFPAPVVYIAYEIESEQGFGEEVRIRRSVMRAWEAYALPRVDHLVTPNQFRADYYAERHPLRNKPVVVRNLCPRLEVQRTSRLHTELGLPAHVRIVLYHGALMAHRALDNLVKGAAFFNRDIVLVVIGRQNEFYKSTLLPLLEAPEVAQRVKFLPYIPPEEISPYIASADLGVVIYENVNQNNYLCAPTKLYEYVMLGVPVVVPDYPEPRDVLAQYPVGAIMESTEPEAIADAVNRFFAEAPASGVKDAAFDSARLALNWESESRILLQLLETGIAA